jgi:intracellular multiplication protein IcmB
MKYVESVLNGIDSIFAWLSSSLKQTTESYCELETADSKTTLVAHDGSLISIIEIQGVGALIGTDEFNKLRADITQSLHPGMSRAGHAIQIFYSYSQDRMEESIQEIFGPAKKTAKELELELDDLFKEREQHLSSYCADEKVYMALWTRPTTLTKDQLKASRENQTKMLEQKIITKLGNVSQNLLSTIPEIRNAHDAFTRSVLQDLATFNISADILEVHEALYAIRMSADAEFTDRGWKPSLPGDNISVREINNFKGDPSDILWPPISKQIMPRNAENLDLVTTKMGSTIYGSVFIELFPKDLKNFLALFNRTLNSRIPWRISFFIESEGLHTLRFKKMISSILSFSSAQNKLLNEATDLLSYININRDEALVRLRVAAATWAPETNIPLLRTRVAELSKAIQGWGTCEVAEVCGDPFAGTVSSMLAVTSDNVATPAVAPLSDVVYMLPITRPASPWKKGALLYRSPDGKLWPFQPGSRMQTTWIDLVYARPGSGKSVLSNAMNLALCLSGGISRLPRIAIIDIGPSSSGLISLLREALPAEKKHLVAYHRLRMTPEYSINPFDTQLGSRFPTPQERAFLVNFLILLATPIGSDTPYDGIADLAGMVVDELYKSLADGVSPSVYDPGMEEVIDVVLEEINFAKDNKTTWFEVTDALFEAGFHHEAMLAQRHAMPLLADAASICRISAIEDLYGKIVSPTGETLINSFSRMISSAVREYPILSRVTSFDIGDSRVVSLDLDEVAKTGGDSADRQTAVMYMLARYTMAKNYYLTEDSLSDIPESYRLYHKERIAEIREDPKRIVYDEFHRTSKSQAVRDQVIVDMREGRKWKVQIALLSQSIEDFDSVMIEFATSIYVMDAGPAAAVEKTAKTFGLSRTAKIALKTRVHGPQEGGATFLAQFATKKGTNIQLLTLTLGPVELWSFSTTSEDAILRNQLYKFLGPKEARRLLSTLFPEGTATKLIEGYNSILVIQMQISSEILKNHPMHYFLNITKFFIFPYCFRLEHSPDGKY